MDTDDLSKNTYRAVIIEAERFHHDLTLQFGLLASGANNDDDYLAKALTMIQEEWAMQWEINQLMDEIFYDNKPSIADFKSCLSRISDNIRSVMEIPLDHRDFEEW